MNVDDFTPKAVLDLCQVKEGDICPKCGAKLTFDHGIEVGNLFKLGTKYAKSMNLLYTDANNEQQPVGWAATASGWSAVWRRSSNSTTTTRASLAAGGRAIQSVHRAGAGKGRDAAWMRERLVRVLP